MIGWPRAVSLVNARVVLPDGIASSLRFTTSVLDVDAAPHRGDLVVDVEGAYVLPGLINAHDHLELNHYGRLKKREGYSNASEWIEDLRPALTSDAGIRRNSSYPLAWRLFIGGVKNLLSGATTVAHHNPRYRELTRGWFPVRVVEKYGWAHSFHLEGQPVGAGGERGGTVHDECARTSPDRPFIVHAAEGVDERAASELPRLEALGCLRPNTVLVHGVAIDGSWWRRLSEAGVSVACCPASNMFLFGRTIPLRQLFDGHPFSRLCIGTDSRLTGANDLLDELRVAAAAGARGDELLRSVTTAAADALKLNQRGRIAVGAPADLVVLPAHEGDTAADALLAAARSDVSLVTIGGMPLVGAAELHAVFAARRTRARPILVDGRERIAAARVAAAIERCPIPEPGVTCL